MALKLPNSICSSQDLRALILEVRGYAAWLSHSSIKQRTGVTTAEQPPAISPAASELINGLAAAKKLTSQGLEELIADLTDFQADAKEMTITLAAPAAGELKQTLVAWCRDNIAPDVLVSFRFSSTILGGMVVRHGSHIYDWSFRRQILANRAAFPAALRKS